MYLHKEKCTRLHKNINDIKTSDLESSLNRPPQNLWAKTPKTYIVEENATKCVREMCFEKFSFQMNGQE